SGPAFPGASKLAAMLRAVLLALPNRHPLRQSPKLLRSRAAPRALVGAVLAVGTQYPLGHPEADTRLGEKWVGRVGGPAPIVQFGEEQTPGRGEDGPLVVMPAEVHQEGAWVAVGHEAPPIRASGSA